MASLEPTRYVGQDAAFLDAFCRAYGLALAKSPDEEGLIGFRELLDATADELRLHQGYAARWEVDLHPVPDAATSAYTNFLLAVSACAAPPSTWTRSARTHVADRHYAADRSLRTV